MRSRAPWLPAGESEGLANGGHLAGDDGHRRDALRVGRGAEQADEPALPHDPPGAVEPLHPDVVQVDRTVHRGAAIGLGDDQQPRLPRLAPDARRQVGERHRDRTQRAQQSQSAARVAHQRQVARVVGRGDQRVLAVAEEGEVVVGQPVHQIDGLSDLLRWYPARGGGHQLGRERTRGADHPRPVAHRAAHVVQHRREVRLHLVEHRRIRLPVDLDVHPRLEAALPDRGVRIGDRVLRALGDQQPTAGVPLDQRRSDGPPAGCPVPSG